MESMLFEVLDRNTFIPVIATQMRPMRYEFITPEMFAGPSGIPNEGDVAYSEKKTKETYLMCRAGYGFDPPWCIFLAPITGGREAHFDCYDWAGNRTLKNAHHFIEQNWDTLRSGDVIDVEFILGETKEPKPSERTLTEATHA